MMMMAKNRGAAPRHLALGALALLAVAMLAAAPAHGQLLGGLLGKLFGAKTPAVVHTPPAWSPKTDQYDPRNKDWNGVMSACKALGQREKRMMNFFIRVAFHDSLAVDVEGCVRGNSGANHPNCGGADSSVLLNVEEMTRPENAYDDFSKITSRAAIKIASFYDVSVSDVIAVCSSVAVELLSAGRVKIIGGTGPEFKSVLRVGRIDNLKPSPPGQLPPANATTFQFSAFWKKHGFSPDEAIALMGTHSLIDDQGCLLSGTKKCNPYLLPCKDVRMFKLENHFFSDACTPSLSVQLKSPNSPPEKPLSALSLSERDEKKRTEVCKFTSLDFRVGASKHFDDEVAGRVKPDVDDKDLWSIDWKNAGCEQGAAWGAVKSCPHIEPNWPYTVNDAFSALACQGKAEPTPENEAIKNAMRRFLNQDEWYSVLPKAFLKMIDTYATFSPNAISVPVKISGMECTASYSVDNACAQSKPTLLGGLFKSITCLKCLLGDCDPCCRCPYSFNNEGYAVRG